MDTDEMTLDEFLKSQWNVLPKLVKQVILERSYREVVQQALTNAGYSEHEDMLEELSLEVLMVLVGLQTTDEFVEHLESGDFCNKEKGAQMANEINIKLLKSLVEEKKSDIQEEMTSEEEEPYLLTYINKDDELSKKYEGFPQHVQTVIRSIKKPEHMATTYQIPLDKEEKLHNEIARVVVGVSTTDEFKKNITNNLIISSLTAQKIFEHTDKNIFTPVKKGLMEAFEKSDTKEEGTPTKTVDPYREPIG